ncbi:MAG: DUF2461 domain-containing protein [Ignavibacteriaceae bacterium]
MNKKLIFDFLKNLSDNNSKEWMDLHRSEYLEAKAVWLHEIEIILHRLSLHDERFGSVIPKDTITRINNNRKFQPDKPVYKDNFTCTPLGSIGSATLHISVSVNPGNSFIAGGLYHPDNETLIKVREAIDYDGEVLKDIISRKKFVNFYSGLEPDQDMLKSAPKGYSKDHKHIDLLRRRNFVAFRDITRNEVLSPKFVDLVEEAYLTARPLNDYINLAMGYSDH